MGRETCSSSGAGTTPVGRAQEARPHSPGWTWRTSCGSAGQGRARCCTGGVARWGCPLVRPAPRVASCVGLAKEGGRGGEKVERRGEAAAGAHRLSDRGLGARGQEHGRLGLSRMFRTVNVCSVPAHVFGSQSVQGANCSKAAVRHHASRGKGC